MLEIHRRTGWLFVAVVVGHLVLISAQAKTERGVPLLEGAILGAFGEVQRAASAGVGSVQRTWESYFALQEIRRENEALRDEVARLRMALQHERAAAAQARALEELLALDQAMPLETAAARVIGGSADPAFRTITIDKGSDDGVQPDMAVITPAGVVGRVVQVAPRSAKVQLLIDQSAAAGAMVERSRAQGIVEGEGTHLELRWVPATADIRVGDRVVTSGLDGIFPSPPAASIEGRYPQGTVIGHIESLQKGAGMFTGVIVRPAVDFTQLEAVLVVLDRPAAARDRRTAAAGRDADR